MLRSVAIACGLLAGCASIRPAETPRGPHFKVMTFNVNYGGPGADRALDAILSEDADVVCLQETTPGWERFLRPSLARTYPFIRFQHEGGAGGLAVFSKHAATEPVRVESAVEWFPAWIFDVQTPAGPVRIANLHLHPGVNERGSFTPAAYLSTSPAARRKEVPPILAAVGSRRPALLVGDFNEGDGGGAVAWLRERGFKDAVPEFDAHGNTWHWTTSLGIKVAARLDHVLYSEDLKCLEARIARKGWSDHFPVVASFEIAAP
jgi:endonuclease/exonuclease/phosphatase (EEP) superfamily protein YafD